MSLPYGVFKECEVCGKQFYVQANRAEIARFCSPECLYKGRRTKQRLRVEKICENCGEKFLVSLHRVETAKFCSKSCVAKAVRPHTKHGQANKSLEYFKWKNMNSRCRRSAWYIERGIQVCEKWRKDFMAFLADMGPIPSPDHSLDRYPNNLGNYEPGNCRWATPKEQGWTKIGTSYGSFGKGIEKKKLRGENNTNAKLTEQDVLLIREAEGSISRREIAEIFNISKYTVQDIQERKSWKHVKRERVRL